MSRYFKLSGAGNDFLALVEPDAAPGAATIRAWCARGRSLGADGLFVLRRRPGGAVMEHFNADGGGAGLCLNGTRCAARLVFHLGWASGAAEIATGAGPIAARETAAGIELELEPPPQAPRAVSLEVDGSAWSGWHLTVGVPHLVLVWPGPLGEAPVSGLGPRLRAHPALGADGANVDFVRFPAPGALEIRSYERGVEGETLACGTGVLAAATVGVAEGLATLPLEALTRGGFRLAVGGRVEGGRPVRLTLAGDARLLAEGTVLPGASAAAEEPAWAPAEPARS